MAGRRAAGLDALWSQCTESLTPSPILSDGSGREKQLAVLLRPERLGRCLFGDYAQEWLAQRTDLRPRSRDQYASLIANHLGPAFGDMELARVNAGQVRSWYALTSARTPAAATSAYRLLWAIFNTAVTDQMVARTPCRIRGAGADRSKERQIPTVAEVEALMRAMPAKLRAAVVLAAWGTLRRGEVLGLRRDDLDVAAGTVPVERSLGERRNGAVIVGPPKSGAGVRTVHMPPSAMQVLQEHLRSFVCAAVDAPFFVGCTGLPLRPQWLEEAWRSAREEVWAARPAFPRPAAFRGHHGGRGRRLDQGGDGPWRVVLAADGAPLRARHSRA